MLGKNHPQFFLSVRGGLGSDPSPSLSLQVKSSLCLIPDDLSLLKLYPPGDEEGKGGRPGRGMQRWLLLGDFLWFMFLQSVVS